MGESVVVDTSGVRTGGYSMTPIYEDHSIQTACRHLVASVTQNLDKSIPFRRVRECQTLAFRVSAYAEILLWANSPVAELASEVLGMEIEEMMRALAHRLGVDDLTYSERRRAIGVAEMRVYTGVHGKDDGDGEGEE